MTEKYLRDWHLVQDGDAILTPSAHLLPVRRQGKPAMLKISDSEEERRGSALMEWWAGDGAAPVIARDDSAVLLERSMGPTSLADLARTGRDDEACRVLCDVVARLHAPKPKPVPALMPLQEWFRDIEPMAARHGSPFVRCAVVARSLFSQEQERCVLHGDLHHGNVLDFGDCGWRAIDPKGLYGERGFDYANIFLNPDLSDPMPPVATDPGRFSRRLAIVIEAAGLDRKRLLSWIVAWTGLSASWLLSEGHLAPVNYRIIELALSELDR